MNKVLIGLVRMYQKFISPLIFAVSGPSCRFQPSCSQYAVEALGKHGALKGSCYAAYRLVRCQPFSKGGYDPVP